MTRAWTVYAPGSTIGAIGDHNTVTYNTYTAAVAEVSWPVRVGLSPAVADRYQDRGVDLAAALDSAGGSATVVCVGMGGTGKTQLAAAFADTLWNRGELDLLVWISASTRGAVMAGYAAAAREVNLELDGRDIEQAVVRLLSWLEQTDRRWLVVLDDLAEPGDLDRLWPSGPAGQVLVTTRRCDAVLRGRRRAVLEVDVFTPEQAIDYLHHKLSVEQADDVEGVVDDLGRLPLALALAAAYIADRPMLTCRTYRARFAERKALREVLPGQGGDGYDATIDATWSLSIDAANTREPTGMAGRVLDLAAWLNPNGIPVAALTTSAAAGYLAADGIGSEIVDDAVSNLALFSLVDVAKPGSGVGPVIRVHGMVQRTAREPLDAERQAAVIRVLADALVQAWPADNQPTEPAALFRANADTLWALAGDQLFTAPRRRRGWHHGSSGGAHEVLFLDGESLKNLPLQAVTYWEEFVSTALRILGPDHPDTLASRNNLAGTYQTAGRPAAAIELFEATLRASERNLAPNHPNLLIIRNNLAAAYRDAGRANEAIPIFEAALTALERHVGPDHPITLSVRDNLAGGYLKTGRLTEAIALYESTAADRVRILGPDHPDTLATMVDLAGAYRDAGRETNAIPLYESTLTAAEESLGPEHPVTLATRNNLAAAYQATDRAADAIPLHETTLSARERILGPEHPDTLTTRNNLAAAYQATDAIRLYETNVTVLTRVHGPDDPATLRVRNDLAGAYHAAGRLDSAIALLEAILPTQERIDGPDDPGTLAVRSNLAAAYQDAGRPVEAIQLYESTLAAFTRILGPDSPYTKTVEDNLAAARAAAED